MNMFISYLFLCMFGAYIWVLITLCPLLVFGSEKRSNRMPVFVSSMIAAHSSLWVGTENGVIVSFPFNRPALVGEETGWEVIKVKCFIENHVSPSICPSTQDAEVEGKGVPEPFDVRTEEALDASMSVETTGAPKLLSPSKSRSDEALPDDSDFLTERRGDFLKKMNQPFNPFCNVDQVQVSIHCHVNGVNCLVCAPGLVTSDISTCTCTL